jgi:cell division septal protein FtsQ
MPPFLKKPRRKSWMPMARFCAVLLLVAMAGWGALELGQRYLGIQRLVIEQMHISGCQGNRLLDAQKIAEDICRGKPLFFFDADLLQEKLESLLWVSAVLIRREPPDRLSIVIEERQPLVLLATKNGILLMSDDGIIMDKANQDNLVPMPAIVDPSSLEEKILVELIMVARELKTQQPEFYARLTEMRWTDRGEVWTSKGPTVFMEGLAAPIYLPKEDPAKNIPNFQALFLEKFINDPSLNGISYFDLRWDGRIPVGIKQGR